MERRVFITGSNADGSSCEISTERGFGYRFTGVVESIDIRLTDFRARLVAGAAPQLHRGARGAPLSVS